jgi:rhodanese-related sulfurtransferase
MRTILSLLIITLLILAGCGTATETTTLEQNFDLVSAQEAFDLIQANRQSTVVLDVRTAEEFAEGHIGGATNIDFYGASFRDEIDALDKDTRYIIYCKSGNRTGQTTDIMRELGFVEVYDINGGIQSWYAAGLPLER